MPPKLTEQQQEKANKFYKIIRKELDLLESYSLDNDREKYIVGVSLAEALAHEEKEEI
jgi:hypothetical protein